MGFIDLVIVYLACGAPFAVYRATGSRSVSFGSLGMDVSIGLFLWPILGIRLLSGLDHPRKRRAKRKPDVRIERIRSQLETFALKDARPETLFRFREAFYRLAGLSTASRQRTDRKPFELFEVSRHPDASLATACLARRNARRVIRHRSQAFVETASILDDNGHSESIIASLYAAFPGIEPFSLGKPSISVPPAPIPENAGPPR